MSYERMQKDDVRLRAEIQEWFERAQAPELVRPGRLLPPRKLHNCNRSRRPEGR